jgi:TRAP transporter 4TM/12TM fusion protein
MGFLRLQDSLPMSFPPMAAQRKETLMAEQSKTPEFDPSRYKQLPPYLRVIFFIFSALGIATATIYMTNTTLFGWAMPSSVYFYLLYLFFLPLAYLVMPARAKDRAGVPWYDLLAAGLCFAIPMYFIRYYYQIVFVGWLPAPTTSAFLIGLVYSALILEACRRMGGTVFFLVCLGVGLYPLVSQHMPSILFGIGYSFKEIISYAIYGGEGIIGMPGKLTGGILVGFLIFAGMLISSGAGEFFLNLATAMMGLFRGGPAKVAVLSSGFFGMLSGSPISNVISTGTITIPAMKKIGYPPHYAGAIEACASTGGVLMPPVMGMIIFVMVIITSIPYAEIMVAAAVPAFLYYAALLVQVDLHAARHGFKGTPRQDIPPFWKTMKEGWHFITVIVFLVWGLLYMRWAEVTPYYASGLLLVLSYFNKKTRMTPRRIAAAIDSIGKLIAQMVALILPFTFILVGLVITGTSASFAAGLVSLGGGNVYLILLLTILACYLLGTVGFDIAAYIFLAISVAPALEQLGLNKMAVHLFLVYYPMLAVLTPPVALAAFVGAAIAGASPMKTGWTAMRLGIVIYFIPLLFVLEPSMVLQGPWQDTLFHAGTCFLGILVLAFGLEGFIWGLGRVEEPWKRAALFVAGVAMSLPSNTSTLIGALATLVMLAVELAAKKAKRS